MDKKELMNWAVDNKLRFTLGRLGDGFELFARCQTIGSRIPLAAFPDELELALSHLADCIKTGVDYDAGN